jgi:HAD superfamily hydrolase (TIGR01509 family)
VLRAVFFDFDGLILDTELPDRTAWQDLFAAYDELLPDDLWKEMIGRTIESVKVHPADLLCQRHPTLDRAALILEQKERRAALIEEQSVLPGISERIAECNSLGLELAVVSSSDRAWVEGYLSKLGLDAFPICFCGKEGTREKPDPDLYLAAMAHYGVSGPEGLALEDSPNGICAAKAAGLWCLAVPNVLTSEMDLSLADFRAKSLAEVSIEDLKLRIETAAEAPGSRESDR